MQSTIFPGDAPAVRASRALRSVYARKMYSGTLSLTCRKAFKAVSDLFRKYSVSIMIVAVTVFFLSRVFNLQILFNVSLFVALTAIFTGVESSGNPDAEKGGEK